MNLNELQENNKAKLAQHALKEHYNVNIDLSRLNVKSTREMLGKVRSALKEARGDRSQHNSHQSPAYLKMLMMEQMLSNYYEEIKAVPRDIVLETEDVVEAQVLVTIQGMADKLQKLLSQISRMKVEELNAVVVAIGREYGTQQGETFNQAVSTALGDLEQSISSAKDTIQSQLNVITGQQDDVPASSMDAGFGAETPMGDEGAIEGEPDLGADLGGEPGGEFPELDDTEPTGPAGRGRR